MQKPIGYKEVYNKVKNAAETATPEKQRTLAETCLHMVLNNPDLAEDIDTHLTAEGYSAIADARKNYSNCSFDTVAGWIKAIDKGYLGDGDMSAELLFVLSALTAWEAYLRTGAVSATQDICEIMLNIGDYQEMAPLDNFLASDAVALAYAQIMTILT